MSVVPWLESSDCWMKLNLELKLSPGGVGLAEQGLAAGPGLSLRSLCGLGAEGPRGTEVQLSTR